MQLIQAIEAIMSGVAVVVAVDGRLGQRAKLLWLRFMHHMGHPVYTLNIATHALLGDAMGTFMTPLMLRPMTLVFGQRLPLAVVWM